DVQVLELPAIMEEGEEQVEQVLGVGVAADVSPQKIGHALQELALEPVEVGDRSRMREQPAAEPERMRVFQLLRFSDGGLTDMADLDVGAQLAQPRIEIHLTRLSFGLAVQEHLAALEKTEAPAVGIFPDVGDERFTRRVQRALDALGFIANICEETNH